MQKSLETYEFLKTKLTEAISHRDELRRQQQAIDEQLDDQERVILALERSFRTLHYAINGPKAEPVQSQPRPDEFDEVEMDRISAAEMAAALQREGR